MRRKRYPVRYALLIGLAAAVMFGGCSAFQGSTRMDVGPFASNTASMVGELAKFARPASWLYLKKYQTIPEVQEGRAPILQVLALMRGISRYSVQLLALQESALKDKQKAVELAKYIAEVARPSVESGAAVNVGITLAEFDAIIERTKAQPTLMDALREAQPLISAITANGDRLFDEITAKIDKAALAIAAGIEADFAGARRNIVEIEALQTQTINSLAMLYRYQIGSAASLDTLLNEDQSLKDLLKPGIVLSRKDVEAAEQRLKERLASIRAAKDQLAEEFTFYGNQQRELNEIRVYNDDRARMGRATLNIFAQSHRNLAAGIAVPPEIDIFGTLQSGAKGIVRTVVPGVP